MAPSKPPTSKAPATSPHTHANNRNDDHPTALPAEILCNIISYIDVYPNKQERRSTLLNASLVSRTWRDLCTPFLFRSIVVTFSLESLFRFKELSVSRFARLVKEVEYKAPHLVHPGTYICLFSHTSVPRTKHLILIFRL
jgi:hypothetical protein